MSGNRYLLNQLAGSPSRNRSEQKEEIRDTIAKTKAALEGYKFKPFERESITESELSMCQKILGETIPSSPLFTVEKYCKCMQVQEAQFGSDQNESMTTAISRAVVQIPIFQRLCCCALGAKKDRSDKKCDSQ